MRLVPFDHGKEIGAKHIVVFCISCNKPVYHGYFDRDGRPFRDYYCTPCGNQRIVQRTASGQIDPKNEDEEIQRFAEDDRVQRGR